MIKAAKVELKRNPGLGLWLVFLMVVGCIGGYHLKDLVTKPENNDPSPILIDTDNYLVAQPTFKRSLQPFDCFNKPLRPYNATEFDSDGDSVYRVAPASTPLDVNADFYCNGTSDERQIQAAINMGQSVFLLPGMFTLSNNLKLRSDSILRGAGIDKTFLRLVDNAVPFDGAGMLRGFHLANVTVTALTIDGNRKGQVNATEEEDYGRYGFYCEVCDNIRFEKVRITSFSGYGFDPHGEPGEAVYSSNITIANCIAEHNGYDGFTIDKTHNALIENSISRHNGRHGINLVTGTKNSIVRSNYVDSNGYENNADEGIPGAGIAIQDNSFFGTGNNQILSNKIFNSANDGIRVRGAVGDSIINNVIKAQGTCITAINTTDLVLKYNDCNGQGMFTQSNQNITLIVKQTGL